MTGDRSDIFIGVGAVVFRGAEVLLVKRGRPPFLGQWSIPGGGLHHGESVREAARREVREETGVEIEILGLIDVFEALPGERVAGEILRHTLLVDFFAEWKAGEPRAGDDASAAEFVGIDLALERLSWDKTRQAVRRAVELRAAKAL
ncbi:MAG TPA: NUDIX hydrolase [Parvularculaceae bacterium]|nr:NUDIX hydrolase [Parvularculaceae bacterium]